MSDLTPDEAKFLLDLLRQFSGGIKFEIDNPEKAIEAATLYKSIIEKLRTAAEIE